MHKYTNAIFAAALGIALAGWNWGVSLQGWNWG